MLCVKWTSLLPPTQMDLISIYHGAKGTGREKLSLSGLHCVKTRRCSLLSSLWSATLGTEEASLEAAHPSGRHASTEQDLANTVWRCGRVLGRHSSTVFLSPRTLHPQGPWELHCLPPYRPQSHEENSGESKDAAFKTRSHRERRPGKGRGRR